MSEDSSGRQGSILVPPQLAPDRMPGSPSAVDRSLLTLPGLREFAAVTFHLVAGLADAVLPGRTSVIPRRNSS
jgi:hypothetical protein